MKYSIEISLRLLTHGHNLLIIALIQLRILCV
jgi:hypothetical protein